MTSLDLGRLRHLRSYAPGLVVLLSAYYGVSKIAPRTYPVAYAEHHGSTAPLRMAREMHLKDALVLIHPEDAVTCWCNLNQNAPFDPQPDVLFLGRQNPAEEVCAAQHFPGRKWYRAHVSDELTPISVHP